MNIRDNSFVSAVANIVSAAMLVIIVILISVVMQKSTPQPPQPEEKVVEVVGRVTRVFDGLGADVGFLVRDGDTLKIAPYDEGSMAAQKGYQPNYISMMDFGSGKLLISPLVVEKFH